MTHTLHGVTLEIVTGDIASQDDVDTVVNAANAQLQTGGGVAGAIHDAAGPELAQATRPLAPIQPGEAVITDAFDLPNDYVIHVLGPIYGRNEPADKLLRAGYVNALDRAEENDVTSMAFPAISTGAFGFPLRPATQIALEAVSARTATLTSVRHVRFVVFDDDTRAVYEEELQSLVAT